MLRVRSLLILLIVAGVAMAGRDARSPGGSGWQSSSGFGQPSIGGGRSFGWSNSRSGVGHEEYGARSNGWSRAYGGSTRSGSSPAGTGWDARGRNTGSTFGANTYKFNDGWSTNSGGWPVSGSSSNSWAGSGLARSNEWQSSPW